MNACKRIQNHLIKALYNELAENEREDFQYHLKTCPSCREDYEKMAATLKVMDQRERPQASENYLDKFWFEIKDQIEEIHKEKSKQFWFKDIFRAKSKLRWILAPLSAILLIMTGIFIGRNSYKSSVEFPANDQQMVVQRGTTDPQYTLLNPVLNEHLENILPMLIDCSNSFPEENTNDTFVLVDKQDLKKLIFQNYLLKKMVANSKDTTLKQLLEELELILVEMSNRNGDSHTNIQNIRKIIKQSDILFKTKIYSQKSAQTKI